MTTDTLTAADSLLPFYQWQPAVADTHFEASLGLPADTLYLPVAQAEAQHRPTMFRSHSLQPVHSQWLPRAQHGPSAGLFVLLFLMATALCVYFRNHKLRVVDVLVALIDRRTLDRLQRNNNLGRPAQMMLMGFFVCAAVSVGLFHALLPAGHAWQWALLFVALVTAYFTRNGLLRVLGNVYQNPAAVVAYINSNYFFHLALSAMLLLPLTLMVYLPSGGAVAAGVCVGLVGLFMVWRIVRGVRLFLTQAGASYLFLFYYLCIVEAIPVLVLLKQLI